MHGHRDKKLEYPGTAHNAGRHMKAVIDDSSVSKAPANGDIAMMTQWVPEQDQKDGQGQVAWQFSLSLSMPQINHMDVAPLLRGIVNQIEADSRRKSEIFLILSELFNNALDHGLLKLDSALKHHPEGMDKYFDERARRLASVQAGQIDMHLEKIVYAGGGMQLRIRMRDSGDGFDYRHTGNLPATETQRHGRGIALLNSLCSSVQYLGNGSEVLACYNLSSGAISNP